MTFTAHSHEVAADAVIYQAPDSSKPVIHIEESPCIVMPAVDLRRAMHVTWRPRTMQDWLT